MPHAIQIKQSLHQPVSKANSHACCACGQDRFRHRPDPACGCGNPCEHRLAPNLLLGSRKTYDEGLQFLYGRNEFDFVGGALRGFLDRRRPGVNVLVKRIALDLPAVHWATFLDAIGLELDGLTFRFPGAEATVEQRAWAVFSEAYWYLKSLDVDRVKSVVGLSGKTVAPMQSSSSGGEAMGADAVEEAVRARIVALLADDTPELRARVVANHRGAYIDPAAPHRPPSTWPTLYDPEHVYSRWRDS